MKIKKKFIHYCECSDLGCPVHKGRETCGNRAKRTLRDAEKKLATFSE